MKFHHGHTHLGLIYFVYYLNRYYLEYFIATDSCKLVIE